MTARRVPRCHSSKHVAYRVLELLEQAAGHAQSIAHFMNAVRSARQLERQLLLGWRFYGSPERDDSTFDVDVNGAQRLLGARQVLPNFIVYLVVVNGREREVVFRGHAMVSFSARGAPASRENARQPPFSARRLASIVLRSRLCLGSIDRRDLCRWPWSYSRQPPQAGHAFSSRGESRSSAQDQPWGARSCARRSKARAAPERSQNL